MDYSLTLIIVRKIKIDICEVNGILLAFLDVSGKELLV